MQGNQSPSEVLAHNIVLTPTQIATVLGLVTTRGAAKGRPDPRKARELIRSGALALVDSTQPANRWTVSSAELRRYVDSGPRKRGAA